MSDEVAQRVLGGAREMLARDNRIGTHYPECWRNHPLCMVNALAVTGDALLSRLHTLEAEKERLRDGLQHIAENGSGGPVLDWVIYATDVLSFNPRRTLGEQEPEPSIEWLAGDSGWG